MHLANLFTKPDNFFIKIYNAPLMLYTGNDYKSPWTKTTLHVNGLGFYWRIQAVDNIDIYILLKQFYSAQARLVFRYYCTKNML